LRSYFSVQTHCLFIAFLYYRFLFLSKKSNLKMQFKRNIHGSLSELVAQPSEVQQGYFLRFAGWKNLVQI
jgi:CRISPR-associated protein Cas8b1/Cst1 subtype I-B